MKSIVGPTATTPNMKSHAREDVPSLPVLPNKGLLEWDNVIFRGHSYTPIDYGVIAKSLANNGIKIAKTVELTHRGHLGGHRKQFRPKSVLDVWVCGKREKGPSGGCRCGFVALRYVWSVH